MPREFISLGMLHLGKYKAFLICSLAKMDLTIVLCKAIEVRLSL